MQRDVEVNQALEGEGWTVLRFWGNDIKKKTKWCADIIERAVTTGMKVYKSIDLFAGIGGIRLGFEKAFKNQIETVFVSEWDEYAQKTYRANFKDDFEIAGDITKIDESDVPEFDICLAGFPCQAFSLAGKRQGFEDNYKGLCRGTLFLDVARICEHHHPSVIFCENVKGLVIHDRGRTLQIIKKLSPTSDIRCLRITIQHLTVKISVCLKTEKESILWHLEMILHLKNSSSHKEMIIPKELKILLKKILFPQNITSAMYTWRRFADIKPDMKPKETASDMK